MNRSERSRRQHLDTALDQRDAAVAAADAVALERLQRAGFRFESIEEAKQYRRKVRHATRVMADLAVATAAHQTERKTA